MKIVITRPSYRTHLITPALGMGYVSAYARARGHDVRVVDGLRNALDNRRIAAACADAAMVGISCMSAYLWETIDLAKILKAAGKTVVIGGPHATVMPEQALRCTGADFAVVGEGEATFSELASAIDAGRPVAGIPGLWTGSGEAFSPREFFEDLDALPLPDWDQIDPRTYPPAPHGAVVKAFPVAPVTSSRGCPFGCRFCASPRIWGRRIRFRSPEKVVDEIEVLVRKYGVREIHFEDDNLTLRKSHVQGICEGILSRGIRVHWAAPNGIRVDAVSADLLRLMKRSGCYSVAFGIESGSQEILDGIDKKTDLAKIREAVTLASGAGLITQAFIIFGLPGETRQTIRQTMDLVLSLPLHKAQFLLLDVLPGSRIWDDCGDLGLDYFRKRSYQEAGYVPKGLTAEELRQARSKAFRDFHLRPRQLFTLMRLFKFRQVRYVAQRLRDFSVFRR